MSIAVDVGRKATKQTNKQTAFNYMYIQSSIMPWVVAFPGHTKFFVLILHGNVMVMPNQLGVDYFHFV